MTDQKVGFHPGLSCKNSKAPQERNSLWEAAGGDCFDHSPWKAGTAQLGRDKAWKASSYGAGGQRHPVPHVESRAESIPCPSLCPSDFWKLSAFTMRPGPQGSTWNRPGYNYRFILPAETKSKSSLLPSSKQSLGNSEKLISGEERFS